MSLYDDLESISLPKPPKADNPLKGNENWKSSLKLLASHIQLKKVSNAQNKDKSKAHPLNTSGGSTSGFLRTIVSKKEKNKTVVIEDTPPYSSLPIQQNDELSEDWHVDDEYNALFPNVYEKLVEQRSQERVKQLAEVQKRLAYDYPSSDDDDSSDAGEFGSVPEKRSTGVAIAPPQALVEEDNKVLEESNLAGSSTRQDHVPGSKGLDFAARIMERYGYKQGSGLGKAEQGMSTALQVEKTGARLGKIVHEKDMIRGSMEEEPPNETVEYPDSIQAPAAAASVVTQQEAPPPVENVTTLLKSPTKVMLLRNMVGAGDVDADLQPEVQDEMAKYGDVQKCLVFEIPNAVSWDAVRIFVEFAKVEQAIKVSDFGVRGVAVEEVYDLHSPLNRRAYGFVFLFKWLENDRRNRHEPIASANGIYASRPKAPKDMFFAKQIVENACATYALLNILLNCEHVELGPTLEDLKESTKGMNASEKGQAISEIAEISKAHNSHARQECASSLLCAPRKKRKSSSYQAKFVQVDSFHFSSFIYSKGHVYELDGLKDEPLDLGAVPAEVHWTEHFQRLITGRVFDDHSTSQQEIRYSLMAVIPCPLYEAQRRLKELEEKLQLLRQELEAETIRLTPKTRSSTASISKGVGRFLNFLESSSTPLRLRRCACKQSCLKSPPIARLDESSRQEEISLDYQIAMTELLTPVLPHAERNKICIPVRLNIHYIAFYVGIQRTVALMRYAQAEIERLRSSVAEQQERRNQYVIDDERRVHDYEPFIRTFLLRLADLEKRGKRR
ncbi:hypothetical protein M514_10459 [Trichuris suis]|uniref:ubiquitinyl hydrolase 1 n=1 Tax=Trichuris suis TaxID=68888 RepID=A0A085LUM9_9BILA|nr:hypothetical protein M513_10459 [Trichuris suis]KFD70674.1 hypothetical protein M514_10459 [Trichuris suis]